MWTLVMGKGGVGKSSTVNSLIDERVAVVSAFQSETTKAFQHARSRTSFTLNIINTLGLVEGGGLNDQDIGIIRRFLLNKTIDVFLYVDQLDSYHVGNLDMQVIRAITQLFGETQTIAIPPIVCGNCNPCSHSCTIVAGWSWRWIPWLCLETICSFAGSHLTCIRSEEEWYRCACSIRGE